MTGIYEILCTANGRRYIGSSVDIAKRWRNHRRDLENGTHKSRYLQRAWRKHGALAFGWAVLEETTADGLIPREQFYLDAGGLLFNSSPTAGNIRGYRHTPTARQKMSTAKLGTTRSSAARAAVSAGGKRRFRESPPDPKALLGRFVSKGWAANLARTHCRNDHPFTDENTFRHKRDGARGCRTCRRAAFHRWYAKRRKSAA